MFRFLSKVTFAFFPFVTVNKNGTIVAKKAGKAVVKVKVTLKNGKTKTVKMTIKVTK